MEREINPVKTSLRNNLHSIYLATSTLSGTKTKIEQSNQESINQANKKNEKLTILLHGYLANHYRSMHSAVEWFKKRDLNPVSFGYNYKIPTRESALEVKTQIDEIREKTNTETVNLIGICLGGVVARYYAEKLNGKEAIHKLVTVHSPLKPLPERNWIFQLHKILGNKPELSNQGIKEIEDCFTVKNHLSLYGIDDKIIRPEYAKTDKIKQTGVSGGHLFISYNPAILQTTLDYLLEN